MLRGRAVLLSRRPRSPWRPGFLGSSAAPPGQQSAGEQQDAGEQADPTEDDVRLLPAPQVGAGTRRRGDRIDGGILGADRQRTGDALLGQQQRQRLHHGLQSAGRVVDDDVVTAADVGQVGAAGQPTAEVRRPGQRRAAVVVRLAGARRPGHRGVVDHPAAAPAAVEWVTGALVGADAVPAVRGVVVVEGEIPAVADALLLRRVGKVGRDGLLVRRGGHRVTVVAAARAADGHGGDATEHSEDDQYGDDPVGRTLPVLRWPGMRPVALAGRRLGWFTCRLPVRRRGTVHRCHRWAASSRRHGSSSGGSRYGTRPR